MTSVPSPVPSNADHTASSAALHLSEGPQRCTWRLGAEPSQSPHQHAKPSSHPPPPIADSILDCIGNTPLVRLRRLAASASVRCELLGKCEYFNAGGSVKDRIGKRMVEDAELSGRIRPGDTLIEPTSGNTGIGLALAAAVKGYGMLITLPEKMSSEKVDVLKALGAVVIRTPTEAAFDSCDSHIGVARRLQREMAASHILDQYANPSNPLAHYDGTAEELLTQCGGRIDAVVIAAGTGGTITGIARKLKERLPAVRIVGVDPLGSILAQPAALNGRIAAYKVEGIGYDFIPTVLDRPLVDEWVKTTDAESFLMARRLIREEGLLVGGSSGSAMVAALKVAATMTAGQRCVVILADSVRNYMSKFLSDSWMVEQGFMADKSVPSVSVSAPLSSRSPSSSSLLAAQSRWWQRRTVADLQLAIPYTVTASVSCQQALDILSQHGYDQLPVLHSNDSPALIGVVTMGNLTSQMLSGRVTADDSITRCLYTQYSTVHSSTPLSDLSRIFDRDHFVLVVASQRCVDAQLSVSDRTLVTGIVTRIDLLNFIVRHRPNADSHTLHEPDSADTADTGNTGNTVAERAETAAGAANSSTASSSRRSQGAQMTEEKKEAVSVMSLERM